MATLKQFTLLILTLLIFSVHTEGGTKKTTTLFDRTNLIIYIPTKLNQNTKQPLLIALPKENESEKAVLDIYKPIAEKYHLYLVIPFGKKYQDNLKKNQFHILQKSMHKLNRFMISNYQINENKTILAGSSKSGNLAFETGLKYPQVFKNIIMIASHFIYIKADIFNHLTFKTKVHQLKKSKFVFITGKTHKTKQSLIIAKRQFKKHKLNCLLKTYPTLTNAEFLTHFQTYLDFFYHSKKFKKKTGKKSPPPRPKLSLSRNIQSNSKKSVLRRIKLYKKLGLKGFD